MLKFIIRFCSMLFLITCSCSALATEMAVIINSNNAYHASQGSAMILVRQFYLGNRTQWPDGTFVEPYARTPSSLEYKAFLRNVLGMTAAQYDTFWETTAEKAHGSPPRVLWSDVGIVSAVAKNTGAIGIVKANAVQSRSDVRILFTFSSG